MRRGSGVRMGGGMRRGSEVRVGGGMRRGSEVRVEGGMRRGSGKHTGYMLLQIWQVDVFRIL